MQPPLQLVAELMKKLFGHIAKEGVRPEGHDFVISFQDKNETVNINGHATFAHGHWTDGPQSAFLRVENLLVQLKSGTGTVDFVIFILPIQQEPQIVEKQVEVNGVYTFHGSQIEDFVDEFRRTFAEAWNQRK